MSTPDFATLMQESRLPERAVPVCMRGDLTAEFQALERELLRTARAADSLEAPGTGDVLARMQALEEQMQASTYLFRLRALPRPQRRRLIDAHPPRRDDEGAVDERDTVYGQTFNTETLYDELVRRCVYDPVLSDKQWRELLGDSDTERARREAAGEQPVDGLLLDAQIEALVDAAVMLNFGDVDIPFSRAASAIRRSIASE